MAYVLGFFASDGCMYKNKRGSCYVSFKSTDLPIIEIVKKITRVKNAIEIYRRQGNFKARYTLQVASRSAFEKLVNLGFTPHKSKTLLLPEITDKFFTHFLRGYVDGDGCVYSGYTRRKKRPGIARHLQLNIRCGSKLFLESLQVRLLNFGLGPGSLYYHSRAYSLAYSGENVVKLYGLMYPSKTVPCLERKRELLEKGIRETGPKCNGLHNSLSRNR